MNSLLRQSPPLPLEDLEHVLTHTRDLWEELRGQQIFITGGTGFFGLWLLETFAYANDRLSLGAHASVLTRNPEAFAIKAPHLAVRTDLQFIQGDVRRFQFPEGEFSFVIHAGTTSGSPVEPLEMFDTITLGTRRVLDFAASHGTRKLLFTSSGGVYGKQPPEMTHIPEDYLGAFDSMDTSAAAAYGGGKRAAEMLCILNSRRHGFEAKIARGFTFVGPHLPLDAHFAIGNFIRHALRGGAVQVQGDGTPFRSYLYAADLAVWLWTILFRGTPARAYNVGSRDEVSISQLAVLVGSTLGNPYPVQASQPAVPGEPPSRYVPDVNRAEVELGLRQTVALPEAIRRTANWGHSTSQSSPA